jgi:urease accessory protein
VQKEAITYIVLWLAAILVAPPAVAHDGINIGHGLADGFMHPASGIEHLLVAIAAGFWAARSGDHGVPDMLYFLALFAGGLMLGAASLVWLQLEIVTPLLFALTVAVIAVAIALPQWFYHALFGGSAVYLGLVHMLEVPATSAMSGFGIGLFLSTAVLLKLGLMLRTVITTFRSHPSD